MKTYSHNILAALAVSACVLTGCFEMVPDSERDGAPKMAIAREAAPADEQPVADGCTYSDRKTERVIDSERGVIMKINESTYVISADNGTQRYTVCSLPQALRHEGAQVVFSGNVKEVFPYERWMANPFEVTRLAPFGN